MRKNPLQQSKFIGKSFSTYVKSTFTLKNNKYNEDFQKELDNLVLTKGPYLKVELPFAKSFSLTQLMHKNEISPQFAQLSNLNLDQTLYLHQYHSLKRLQANANVVITTGTGSGKTEAFLYPILDKLLRRIEKGEKLKGIQAILLYPMNALVNDQLRRLRKILQTFPDITFGYFTGDTKESYRIADRNGLKINTREEYIKVYHGDDEYPPPINEKLIREEVYNDPPNILITNYSMLEYLLVRPKFSEIINKETLSEWSFMVLDEAHTYRGITATEVSHLLKRLQYYATKTPQFILTSATLGSREDEKIDIIKFAERLTSVSYSEDDIIYATRVSMDSYDKTRTIDIDDYAVINNKILNNEPLEDILKSYNAKSLSDLLIGDSNVHLLYDVIKETKTFQDTLTLMKNANERFSEESLVSLINLITSKKTEGDEIYDIKYHYFLRTLEGAFVSLEPNPKLKITNRQMIDDLWAFEIGACRFCDAMYILGKEHEGRLYRTELDLEENYADFEEDVVNFFLVKEEILMNYDGDLGKDFEECTVCSKCGFIYQNNIIDHGTCDCEEKYKVALLKVKRSDKQQGNLNMCPVCGKKHNKFGIINSFRLGKDQSTSLIAQIILESMGDTNKEKVKKTDLLEELFTPTKKLNKKRKPKQFLAFSDSRQQASFFALFFQVKQDDFLRKALVVEVVDETKSIDKVISGIEDIITQEDLLSDDYEQGLSPVKNAYVSVLKELLKVDGKNSLEGLAIINFEPDLDKVFALISEEKFSAYFPKIPYSQFKTVLCIFVNFFRMIPAVNFADSGLTTEDRRNHLSYRSFDNYVVLDGARNSDYKSIKPARETQLNNLYKYLMKTFNLTFEETTDYCTKIWGILSNERIKIINTKDNHAGQLNFSSFKVYPSKEQQWYQCEKCKSLTVHNINNSCVVGSCDGQLIAGDPDELLANNYYRNEYLKKRIEKMIAKEHTGQLSREKGTDYQKDFKNKKINVLSSSTTFEMGIDIGDLDTVFMRNIPPTNANYAQRAGRAGRSDESVALIITYANHNSHDQIYFNDPIPMIEGRVKPPYFNLENNKITFRHIMAVLLSDYYRSHNLEHDVGNFIKDYYNSFLDYIELEKSKLEEKIKLSINEEAFEYFAGYVWLEEVKKNDSLFMNFINKMKEEIKNLEDAVTKMSEAEQYDDASFYKQQLRKLLKMDITEGFAKNNVIPAYGFPIDVVELKINNGRSRKDSNLNFTRNLSIAISEYAPDSEVVGDKNKYTSRYIRLPYEGDLPRKYYYKCENDSCGRIHVRLIQEENFLCQTCGSKTKVNSFIIPELGFITEYEEKRHTLLKPKKTYTSDISYLGTIEPFIDDLNLDDFIKIQRTVDDKLLIINESPFFMCESCGYTQLSKQNRDLKGFSHEHKMPNGIICNSTALKKVNLGQIVITDAIKMKINMEMTYHVALSTMTAMLNGIVEYLQIDAQDINGLIVSDNASNYAFVFYDTTYGGAGNVKQLTNRTELVSMLKVAFASVNNNCCAEEVSCTSCLRSYRNSRRHRELVRGFARDTLKRMLVKIGETPY